MSMKIRTANILGGLLIVFLLIVVGISVYSARDLRSAVLDNIFAGEIPSHIAVQKIEGLWSSKHWLKAEVKTKSFETWVGSQSNKFNVVEENSFEENFLFSQAQKFLGKNKLSRDNDIKIYEFKGNFDGVGYLLFKSTNQSTSYAYFVLLMGY